MPAGRPPKFKTPEELQSRIEEYFRDCDTHETVVSVLNKKLGRFVKRKVLSPRPYTITGLALYVGTTRETLLDYQHKRGDRFSDAIKAAKLKCQNYAEEQLFTPKIAAGVIFNLKNNYGWVDRTETDHTSRGDRIEFVVPAAIANKHGLTDARTGGDRP